MATLIALLVFAFWLPGNVNAIEMVAPSKSYSSCKVLWKKFPWGVAQDKLAVRMAMEDGLARPDVNKKVYKANQRKLDKDRNGVVCDRVTRQQAEEFIGSLFEKALCEKARVEGSQLGPECAKYGYGTR